MLNASSTNITRVYKRSTDLHISMRQSPHSPIFYKVCVILLFTWQSIKLIRP